MKKNKKKEVSLEEQKRTLEKNIDYEQDMIDNNKHYDNEEKNMSFGPNHYKNAIEYDKKELENVNSKLEMQKRIDNLKNRANTVLSEENSKKKKKK